MTMINKQLNLIDMIKETKKEKSQMRKLKELYSKVQNAECMHSQEIAQNKLDNFLFKHAKYKGYEFN